MLLSKDSPEVQYLCKKDKRLAKLISMVGDLPYYRRECDFPRLCHTIINQMLSNKAAAKINERFEALCGAGGVTPANVLALDDNAIRGVGISRAKAGYIKGLAAAVTDGSLNLEELPSLPDDEIIKKLTKLRGFGTWSAKMQLIFVFDKKDVLPYEDGAFMQVYRWMYKAENDKVADIVKRCKKWRPYSSIAARYMYVALDMGLCKEEFHLFKE